MPRDVADRQARAMICVIGLRGIPDVMGGVESHCQELLPRIAARAPHLRLVALGRRAYIGRRGRSFGGVEVVPLPGPSRQSLETLVSSFLGTLYARRSGARAVHIHALASGLVAPLARLLGLKVIFTVHGADYRRAKWGRMARLLLRLGEAAGVRTANATICVAPSLTGELRERYPRQAHRIIHVANGAPAFDASGDEAAALARFGLERAGFVLAVGRIEPGKGFELLVDAFARSGRPGKLVIAGGAHHGAAYAASLMRAAGGRVVFTGALPRGLLRHLYANAALFVLPSLHEGLPICALEAAAAGCPLLLSDIPGNRDLRLSDRHYFRSGDAAALASALALPASRYAVPQGSFSAFDWDDISARTLAVYEAVLGGKRAD